MRCRNCHTGMTDTDTHCPSCHSSAARAHAAAPEPMRKPPNMALLLPMFGGALGGAICAGLIAAEECAASAGSRPSRATRGSSAVSGSSPVKWIIGLLFAVGGGLCLTLAGMHFAGTWSVANLEPTPATAADLCLKDYAASAPDWISYTFAESKPSDLAVTRRRLGNGGEVQARCLLVRVEDKWLVATVAAGFEGNELVGRLLPVDSPSSKSLVERFRKNDANPSSLLPYEFNAVEGCASDQRLRYMTAGWIVVFGVVGLSLGLYLLCGGRRSVETRAAALNTDWTFHSVPKA